MVYVVGHLNPDTDTVVAAMSMAAFLNEREGTDQYVAVMTGQPNEETKFVFDRFGLKFPEVKVDAEGEKLYLVDHNEGTQILKGWSPEHIVGILDHHKMNFSSPGPIEITVRPWGSSNTIIYDLFEKEGLEIPQELKPAMLSAILSDTVILKSVTTTEMDRDVVDMLADEIDVDYKELGMEMFKAKAQIASKSANEIITSDFKNFDFNGKKVGIGQVETPDMKDVEKRFDELREALKSMKKTQGYHSLVLMVTDILQEGSRLIVISDDVDKIEGIFNTSIKEDVCEFLPGIMSRKKQVAFKLAEYL